MNKQNKGLLLRVFINESKMYKGQTLYKAIVCKARDMGMAGATVFKGIMGFQGQHKISSRQVLRLSDDMPVIIEIVDQKDKIDSFTQWLDEVVTDGMVTAEQVDILINRNEDR